MKLIFPVAAGLILFILVATLRSALAPLYLLTAVVLEFAATLGASVPVFQQLGGETGVSFVLPLVLVLFVVALGTDLRRQRGAASAASLGAHFGAHPQTGVRPRRGGCQQEQRWQCWLSTTKGAISRIGGRRVGMSTAHPSESTIQSSIARAPLVA
jgi:hypothetical protein